jgi:hypothetical protein
MRYREFAQLNEGPLDSPEDISAYSSDAHEHVVDDANQESDAALATVLRDIQFAGAEEPKIMAQSLIGLVRKQPGGEAFDKAALEKAKSNKFKDVIKNIEADNDGTMWVHIEPPEPLDGAEGGEMGGDANAEKKASTVSAMAKRAAA